MLILFMFSTTMVNAQAPSHDPSTIIRNTDGRYWVFTTGDGVWCMSSSNADFSNWRAENTPFTRNAYPSWINSAVPGFAGTFWAPEVIKMNGYYYLYYSCSTFGSSRSAIGVARSTNLSGGWTDLGMVISSNNNNNINAIDPALFKDTDGRVWMSYGSWFGGIGVVEINPSTGKTIGNVTHLTGGNHSDIEAPYIMKNGGYYYLFVNRGKCCNGLQSTYYITVGRSTSVTGPYTDWRTFLGSNGRYVGPGHIGYADGHLSYHFYDGQDNGAAKLNVTTLGWNNGWPVAGGIGGGTDIVDGVYGLNGTYQLRNRGTGLVIDGFGNTGNGDPVNQYEASTTHPNSHWQIIDAGSSQGPYYYIQNVGTGMKIDGYGVTTNGEDVAQYDNSTTHNNAQWVFQQFEGYYRIQNTGTGMFMDGMGRTDNGSNIGQYANTTHINAQWELVSINGTNPGGSFNGNVVQLVNRGSGLVIDGYGVTTNGEACNQYDGSTTHPNSQWEMISTGSSEGNHFYFVNIGTNMKLDGMGRTTNGEPVGQYANTTHVNAQWAVEQFDDNYFRIKNQGTGLFMDGMGRTANGEPVGQYANTTHINAQWEIKLISSQRSAKSFTANNNGKKENILLSPNPVIDILNIAVPTSFEGKQLIIYNNVGQSIYTLNNVNSKEQIDLSGFKPGIYSIVISNNVQIISKRFIKQ